MQYKISYDFAQAGGTNDPSQVDAHIANTLVKSIDELSKLGLKDQVRGGMKVNHKSRFFELDCSPQMADKLSRQNGIKSAVKIKKNVP